MKRRRCTLRPIVRHAIPEFDEIVREDDVDFAASGLKMPSLIRVGRLAVVQGEILLGAIGQVEDERLRRIKAHLADWLARA